MREKRRVIGIGGRWLVRSRTTWARCARGSQNDFFLTCSPEKLRFFLFGWSCGLCDGWMEFFFLIKNFHTCVLCVPSLSTAEFRNGNDHRPARNTHPAHLQGQGLSSDKQCDQDFDLLGSSPSSFFFTLCLPATTLLWTTGGQLCVHRLLSLNVTCGILNSHCEFLIQFLGGSQCSLWTYGSDSFF